MPAPKPFSEPELGIASLWERAVSLDLLLLNVGQFSIHNIWYTANTRMSCICHVHIICYVHYTIFRVSCLQRRNQQNYGTCRTRTVDSDGCKDKFLVTHPLEWSPLSMSASSFDQYGWYIESAGIHTNLRAAKMQKEQPCLLWVRLGLVSYFWAPKL